jgi:hypothetical protein
LPPQPEQMPAEHNPAEVPVLPPVPAPQPELSPTHLLS